MNRPGRSHTIFPRSPCSREKLWEAQALEDHNLRRQQRKRPVHFNISLNLRVVGGLKLWFCEPCNGSRLASSVACFCGGPFRRWTWMFTKSLFSHFQMPCACPHSTAMAFGGLVLRQSGHSLAESQVAGYMLRDKPCKQGQTGSNNPQC